MQRCSGKQTWLNPTAINTGSKIKEQKSKIGSFSLTGSARECKWIKVYLEVIRGTEQCSLFNTRIQREFCRAITSLLSHFYSHNQNWGQLSDWDQSKDFALCGKSAGSHCDTFEHLTSKLRFFSIYLFLYVVQKWIKTPLLKESTAQRSGFTDLGNSDINLIYKCDCLKIEKIVHFQSTKAIKNTVLKTCLLY